MERESCLLYSHNQYDSLSKSCFITQNTLPSDSSQNSDLRVQDLVDFEPLAHNGDFGLFSIKASEQIQRSHRNKKITKPQRTKILEALSPSLRSLCSNSHQFEEIMLSLGISPSQDEINQFKKLEAVDSQEVRREMIQSFILELTTLRQGSTDELQDEQVQMAFSLFGKDTNGLMSREQFKNVMAELGSEISEEDLTTFWQKADSDGDGLISIADFKEILSEI